MKKFMIYQWVMIAILSIISLIMNDINIYNKVSFINIGLVVIGLLVLLKEKKKDK